MLLNKYGLKLYIRDAFSYQSVWCRGKRGELSNIFDFMLCGYGVRVLVNPVFVRFITHISVSVSIMLSLTFYFYCAYFSWL